MCGIGDAPAAALLPGLATFTVSQADVHWLLMPEWKHLRF
jgi:hypothetical protein